MEPLLASDIRKNIVVYINDYYPEFGNAFKKLSKRLGRPLRGIMLIDAERKRSGKNLPDTDGWFEEIIVDFSDAAALHRVLQPLEDNLLLVGCESERSQLYFKKVIPHVPYVMVPTEKSIDWSTNKARMREMLSSYNSDITPQAIEIKDGDGKTIERIVASLHFPLIIKPANLNSSILVNRVDDETSLRTTLVESFKSLREVYGKYRGLGEITMVVEEFIEGDTYSIDGYVDATGKCWMLPFIAYQNATMVGEEGYQIYRNETYTTLTDDDILAGNQVAEKAIHAVGLRSSVAHIELFHTTNGWKVVELGARPGGQRQDLYEVGYGIDHALNELLVKVGLEPDIPSKMITFAETFNLYASRAGIVDSVDGIDMARQHPHLHSLEVSVKPGDKAMPSISGGSMLIYGLVQGDNREQLRSDTESLRANIKINVR